jgi:hypothetical protein
VKEGRLGCSWPAISVDTRNPLVYRLGVVPWSACESDYYEGEQKMPTDNSGSEMTEKELIKGPWSWTAEDINLLKKLYPKGNIKMIAGRLNRPLTAVRQKAYDMGMKTDVYRYWTEDDLKLLARLYPDMTASELASQFNRSEGSIKTKALQLKLRKSPQYIKALQSRPRNRRKN